MRARLRRGTRERRGMYLGLVYLVFMAYPAASLATNNWPAWKTTVAAAALLLFAGVYVRMFFAGGNLFRNDFGSSRKALPYALALVVLAFVLPLLLGDTFVGLVIYAAAGIAAVLPPYRVPLIVVLLAVANFALMLIVGTDIDNILTISMITVVSPLSVLGVRQLVLRNLELRTAREENARLAVSEERLRFARDLHDLLGHSLSLIVLKSELAGRVIDRDVGRAANEIADIESVARQALVEVREAVSGYRRSFDEELVGARAALQAADIAVSLPAAGLPLPAPVESLLAWAVREATTNILRHSNASTVSMRLHRSGSAVALTVTDDGVGPSAPGGHIDVGGCHGLRGLAERMSAAGGSIDAGTAGRRGGFRLQVTVPLDVPSYAVAPLPDTAAGRTGPAAAGRSGPEVQPGTDGVRSPAGRAPRPVDLPAPRS